MARTPLGLTASAAVVSVLALLGPIGVGCHGDETQRPTSGVRPTATSASDEAEPEPSPESDDDDPAAEAKSDGEARAKTPIDRPPYTPPSTLGEPLETRLASRTRAVYAEPDPDAALRGRIQRKDSFYVYERREAPDCDKPWAKVAEAAWLCLDRTSITEDPPRPLPILANDDLLPFIYVRHEGHDDPSTPALLVYASVRAFNRGDEPIDTLPAYGSYAFIRSIANHGARVLMTAGRNVVSAAKLEVFKPSEFAGRELRGDAAIPPKATLAWAVRWKTLVRTTADPTAEIVGRVPYHETLYVVGEGVIGSDGERWFETSEPGGWISDHDIRRFLPVAPPAPILAGQITVDIDIDQQVLSIWRDDQPVFATLISSGKPGDATPLGLYRIETKWAYGKMASLASADDPYYVDAVPWAMYFDGRYALHAAYWHDLFGHRLSHGCVNLSPRDAKRVFDLVTPTLPAGWLLVHEHAHDPGAVVRVRNGEPSVPDRRTPLAPPDTSISD